MTMSSTATSSTATSATGVSTLRLLLRRGLRNPLIDKGVHQAAQSNKFLAGYLLLGAISLLATTGAMAVAFDEVTRSWRQPSMLGFELLGGAIGTLVFFAAVIAPLVAAPDIALEREQGTFKLLQTSHLSAGDIVVGKWASLVVKWTLFVAFAAPFLASLSLFGGAGVVDLLWATSSLWVVGAAGTAVGIFVSSLFHRAKSAAPAALLATGGFVALGWVVVLPLIAFAERADQAVAIGWGVLGGWLYLTAVTVVSLVGARSAIAPRSAARTPWRTRIRRTVLVGGPLLASVILVLHPVRQVDIDEMGVAMLGVIGALAVLAALFEGAAVDWKSPRTGDAPTPRRAVVNVLVESLIGFSLVIPFAYTVDSFFQNHTSTGQVDVGRFMALGIGAVVLASSVAAVTSWTVLVARVTKHQVVRLAVPLGIIGALLLFPLFTLVIAESFGMYDLAVGLWLNPFAQLMSLSPFDTSGGFARDAQVLGMLPAVVGGLPLTLAFNAFFIWRGKRP